MTERVALLYPISDQLAADLKAHRYGLYEPEVDDRLESFPDLAALADYVVSIRKGRGLKIEDAALVWGEALDEARAAVHLIFTTRDNEVDVVLTAVCHNEREGHVWQALKLAAERVKAQGPAKRPAA